MILVEAAVESLEDALAAERAGVDRIELCGNLSEGGTTPSAALMTAVIAQVRIPVFVMIRPRGGDFVYSHDEMNAMTRHAELAANKGAGGVVAGALTSDRRVNLGHMRILTKAAAGLPLTFHRAFDRTTSLGDTLEEVIDLGAQRVLTSGGAASALEGVDAIAALVEQARGRLSIMAGGTVRQHNVREIIRLTGVSEVHARLIDLAGMRNTIEAARRSD